MSSKNARQRESAVRVRKVEEARDNKDERGVIERGKTGTSVYACMCVVTGKCARSNDDKKKLVMEDGAGDR